MGRLKQSTEKIQELLDKVESGEVGSKVTPDWNANLGEIGYIQNKPFRIIDSVSGDEYKFDTPLKESDFTRIVQEDEYGNKVSVKWEKIISDPNAYIMGVFTNGYWNARHDAFYKGAIRPLGPLYRRGYSYDEGDYRKYSIYIENISVDTGDYYEEYSKLIVENISDSGTAFPKADVYVLTSEDYPVHIDAIDENYLPDTIARTNEVDELREETTALWENLDHGTFPDLVAGDLAGRGESVPAEFGFRASGGKSIKDGRAYIKRIKGNSVVWNQWVKGFASWNLQGGTIEGNEVVWLPGNRTGALNAFSNTFAQHTTHKYLISADVKASSTNVGLGIYFTNSPLVKHTGSGNYESLAIITNGKGDGVDACYLTDVSTSGYGEIRAKNYRCIDLTQMFQAGNEPSTIEEFNARVATLGIDMYAYNEGQVIHCNTESIKSVGDNAWDEQWELGTFDTTTGEDIVRTDQIRSKNFIEVLPNAEYYVCQPSKLGSDGMWALLYDADKNVIEGYYGTEIINGNSFKIPADSNIFTTAPNARYMRFYMPIGYGDTYKNDIMITLVHSGWKQDTDAGYQPYWQDTLPLPIIRKYFPDGMMKAGSAHDEIRFNKASGKWEYSKGKIKIEDMGDLDWNYFPAADGYPFGFFYANPQGRKYGQENILCVKYAFGNFANDKSILGNTAGENIYIMDSTYTDAASLKASLQGVMLYYESNDWEWVELDAEDQNFRDYYNVADFGTEMSQSLVPSAAFSADIIYQFNAVDMIREHEMEITELQKVIATMQAQLTSLINGGQ